MKKFFKSFSLLGFMMLSLCVLLGIGDVSGAVMTADGAVATDVTTGGEATPSNGNDNNAGNQGGTMLSAGERSALSSWDYRKWAPDLIKDPMEREVIQCRTYATPFDTILSYIGSEKINNLRFKYWQIADGSLSETVKLFVPVTSTDSKEKITGLLYIDRHNKNKVNANDNLLVEGVTGADGEDLYLFVQSIEHNKSVTTGEGQEAVTNVYTALTVTVDADQVVNNGTAQSPEYSIPAIAADTKIYICGNSHNELDVTSPDLEFLPTEKHGYAQIFKREITISNYAQMADKEFKWDLNEIEREVIYRWKKEKEMAFLFGKMSLVYDKNGREVLRTAGIFRTVLAWQKKKHYDMGETTAYLSNGALKVNSASNKPADEFIDMMKNIFVGNNGNTQRWAMAAPTAVAKLSKMMAAGVQKNQDADKVDVVAGITFTKIVSKFGTLNLISHPLFEETPYKDYMIVFDPQFIKKKEVLPVDRQEVDGREHLIVNGKIVILSETAGVAIYNPEAHKVVKFV